VETVTEHIPEPRWTLTGTVLEWPNGQLAPINQSPWRWTQDGWT
jgi:hypothetical protein